MEAYLFLMRVKECSIILSVGDLVLIKKLGFLSHTCIRITFWDSSGFFQTLSLQGRNLPIDIYGPESLYDFLIENIKILDIHFSFNLNIHIISENGGVLVVDKDYKIMFCKSNHGHGISSYAYCLVEGSRPGEFDIKKAKSLGIPAGILYQTLQKGENITFNDKLIPSNTIVGPLRPGRKIGISGDTRPTDELCKFFKNCDLLIFESTFRSTELDKAKESFHSTAFEAANLAKLSGVHKLCLTHFSTRLQGFDCFAK